MRQFIPRNPVRTMFPSGAVLTPNVYAVPHALTAANWEITDGSAAADGADGVEITRLSSDGGSYTVAWLDMPVDLRERYIVIKVKGDVNLKQLWASVICTNRSSAKFTDGTSTANVLADLAAGSTLLAIEPWRLAEGNGTYDDLADTRRFGFRVHNDAGTSTTLVVEGIWVVDTFARPGVATLIFDDGFAGVYDHAFAKLAEHGMRGNVAVIEARVGTTGYMTATQLQELYDAGWDLVAHHDAQLTGFTGTTLQTTLQDMQQYLANQGWTRGLRHLAYPGGSYNAEVIAETQKLYLSARSTASWARSALPVVDRYKWMPVNYVQATNTAANINGTVDDSAAFGGFHGLTFHDIVTSGATGVNYNAADFGAVIDHLATTGMAVLTLSELFEGRTPLAVGAY